MAAPHVSPVPYRLIQEPDAGNQPIIDLAKDALRLRVIVNGKLISVRKYSRSTLLGDLTYSSFLWVGNAEFVNIRHLF